ncbi:MAG: AAA domain-containing protein [Vicinamibacterales bacterium]
MGAGPVDPDPPELDRARQLFQFLKAFAERSVPTKRAVDGQPWYMWLRVLPLHPSVRLIPPDFSPAPVQGSESVDEPLLRVTRPKVTRPPAPPAQIAEFVEDDWVEPNGSARVKATRNVMVDGQAHVEAFDAEPARVTAYEKWSRLWKEWAANERPARAAMDVFEKLYDLRSRMDREGERVELVLGDGRLRWRTPLGPIDHPILLQRVELTFDPEGPEFQLVDAERPPELYAPLLQEAQALTAEHLQQVRTDLLSGAYHPLAREATDGFFTRLAPRLDRQGAFVRDGDAPAPPDAPTIVRDAVLFLRTRQAGFAEAFDKVLQDLELRKEVPASLTRLVGIETPVASLEGADASDTPWGEPADVLLSKPANQEQVRIARAIEQHRAVLVQGPPGTGKSHTIANLIGHLVAQGKRVLVTSHTNKALRVLRSQIVEPLQPLCVAVLGNDLESRSQLEQAVRGILTRLTSSSAAELQDVARRQAHLRNELNRAIADITAQLRAVREAEYTPVVLAGSSQSPSEAARWAREHAAGNDWVPGPVVSASPMPLSAADVATLYGLNGQLTQADEAAIDEQPPDPAQLPTPSEFEGWLAALAATEPEEWVQFWVRGPNESDLPALSDLLTVARAIAGELSGFTPWQRAIVADGTASPTEKAQWVKLAKLVADAYGEWQRARSVLLDHAVEQVATGPAEDPAATFDAIAAHLDAGGGLGWIQTGVLHREWKPLVEGSRVDGHPPRTAAQFRALAVKHRLEATRESIRGRWKRQAEPIGLPPVATGDFEPALHEQATSFQRLLGWWGQQRASLDQACQPAGFQWTQFRDWHAARTAAATAFEHDCRLLVGPLEEAVSARIGMANRAKAMRRLQETKAFLEGFSGALVAELLSAVRTHDPVAYAKSHAALVRLHAKRILLVQRRQLLEALAVAAPAWAKAIQNRVGVHGESKTPGDPETAWQWRQITQELDRRAALDEAALTRQLHQRRDELRAATASLIDAKAWQAQLARTNLAARSALQGWVDTVRKIGKGFGRRVPELQAEARRLLASASAAVPVWIMPLARVAESIDPVKNRFDVVIVDEASQSDVTGLLAWYLGDQVLVVGDHEQVSPLAVGQELEVAKGLIEQHLGTVPNRHLYDGKTSIYDLARQCFGGTIALREHFRCVPEIIGFSDELSYNFEIRPLRNPAAVPRPHVAEFVVDRSLGVSRDGKSNLAEARVAAALLKAMTEHTHYSRSSMGAITLLGDEQAHLIHENARHLIEPVDLERRAFAVGNPAQFQGDERDVMLLSMVDVPRESGLLHLMETDAMKQRYNVAASRARDQLWLIHSLDPGRDLQPRDLRRRLIDYVREPLARHREKARTTRRAESPFEIAVIERLVAAGYSVQPQVTVGSYRIDIVVSDGSRQVAIECDGDRYHPAERLGEDMFRQAVLERAHWQFIRIRGSRFYRDPDKTMAEVVRALEAHSIGPAATRESADAIDAEAAGFREPIVRRAWEILGEEGWIQAEPTMLSALDVN